MTSTSEVPVPELTPERRDEVMEQISRRLERGWTLTNELCQRERCDVPLLRTADGDKYCENCNVLYKSEAAGKAHPSAGRSTVRSVEEGVDSSTMSEEQLRAYAAGGGPAAGRDAGPKEPSQTSKGAGVVMGLTEQQRRERNRAASTRIGEKLLSGWTMMEDNCPVQGCECPFMKDPKGDMHCMSWCGLQLSEDELEHLRHGNVPLTVEAQLYAKVNWSEPANGSADAHRASGKAAKGGTDQHRASRPDDTVGAHSAAERAAAAWQASTELEREGEGGDAPVKPDSAAETAAAARAAHQQRTSSSLGSLLLQGWAMMGEECPRDDCSCPLMRDPRSRELLCTECDRRYVLKDGNLSLVSAAGAAEAPSAPAPAPQRPDHASKPQSHPQSKPQAHAQPKQRSQPRPQWARGAHSHSDDDLEAEPGEQAPPRQVAKRSRPAAAPVSAQRRSSSGSHSAAHVPAAEASEVGLARDAVVRSLASHRAALEEGGSAEETMEALEGIRAAAEALAALRNL